MNFRSFLENNPLKIQNSFSQNTVGRHNDMAAASFLPSTFTGSENLGPWGGLPSTDMTLPVVPRDSTIYKVLNAPAQDEPLRVNDKSNKDPITIMLADKTKIVVGYDEYKRITSGRPFRLPSGSTPGERVLVSFERLPSDTSNTNSRITSFRRFE